MNFFYQNALALIHPSLSEGFGLPIIEAVYFGCPIIASNISVFQELLKGKYVAFNAKDIENITAQIKYFIQHKPIFDYKNIIKNFSFETMAKKTFDLYRQALT